MAQVNSGGGSVPGASREQRIVGRADALEAIQRSLDAVDGGGAAVVELTGDPGIGKTTLLSELRAQADARGHLVLDGRATELDPDAPFAPFVDALDDFLAAQDPDRFDRLGDPHRDELAHVFPALAALGTGSAVALDTERYRAHRAVRALLDELSAAAPLVLALDDLHWADESSLEMLAFLLRRPPRGRVVLALAYRPRQAPQRLRGALAEEPGVALERIAVEPLTRAEADSLIGSRGGHRARKALLGESRGNPFYLEQLLRVPHSAGVEAGGPPELGAGDLPPAVLRAVHAELAGLDPRARTLLQGAAVAGEPFEPELAAAASGADEDETLKLIDELVGLDLIRPTELPRRFEFRHPILRRAVYESAGPGWRLGAHARVDGALAEAGASILARAHHVELSATSGDDRAVELLVDAARMAGARAPASAAHWYGAALRLVPGEDTQRRLALIIPMAVALGSAGHLAASRAALLEALEMLPPDAVDDRVQTVAFLSAVEHQLGRHEQAAARNRAALDALDESDSSAAAALAIGMATDGIYAGSFDEPRVAAGRQALRIARARGDLPVAAAAASVLAFGLGFDGRFDEAERTRVAGAEMVDALADDELALRLDALLHLGSCEYFLERFDDARRHLDRGAAIARASGQGQFLVPLDCMRVYALADTGRVREAREVADAAVEAARLTDNAEALFMALSMACWAAGAAGALPDALEAGEEGTRLARRAQDSLLSRAFHAHFAVICVDAGDPERCVAELALAGPPEFESFEPGRRALWPAAMARAVLGLRGTDEAEPWIRRAEAAMDGVPLPVAAGRVARARAELLLATGEARRAADVGMAAAAAQADRGARVEAARSRVLAARALAGAGRKDTAVTELRAAHAELRDCGASAWADDAARELRRLGRRAPRPGGPAHGHSAVEELSTRELELSRLVAAGRTNKQIAATLFLSEKTVENHLTRIFGKLGVSRRSEVAARIGSELDP